VYCYDIVVLIVLFWCFWCVKDYNVVSVNWNIVWWGYKTISISWLLFSALPKLGQWSVCDGSVDRENVDRLNSNSSTTPHSPIVMCTLAKHTGYCNHATRLTQPDHGSRTFGSGRVRSPTGQTFRTKSISATAYNLQTASENSSLWAIILSLICHHVMDLGDWGQPQVHSPCIKYFKWQYL